MSKNKKESEEAPAKKKVKFNSPLVEKLRESYDDCINAEKAMDDLRDKHRMEMRKAQENVRSREENLSNDADYVENDFFLLRMGANYYICESDEDIEDNLFRIDLLCKLSNLRNCIIDCHAKEFLDAYDAKGSYSWKDFIAENFSSDEDTKIVAECMEKYNKAMQDRIREEKDDSEEEGSITL